MAIFSVKDDGLSPIKELSFNLERDLQQLTEKNLEIVFGLKLIATEFQLNGLRIDSLAFNTETRSFVIIEYKRDRSFSVVDQGYAYLSLVLNNKADFILEYNETQKDNLKRDDVDWSQTRVMFLANSFTIHQKNAINFKDLPIELWEVKKYDNHSILYNQLKSADSSESIKTVSKSKQIQAISSQVQKYQVDDTLKNVTPKNRELFDSLREKILNINPAIEESPQKSYVGYKISWKILVAVNVQKNRLLLDITRTEPKQLSDPSKKAKLVKDSMKHYHQSISRIVVDDQNDVDYAIDLVRQSYDRQYK